MVNPDDITIMIDWEGSLEEYYNLTSEYRILKYKIDDTFEYLDKLLEEYEIIEEEIMKHIKLGD